MPGKEIKGRSKRANYSHGGRAGFAMGSMVRTLRKVPKILKDRVARKKAKQSQAARDKVQKSQMGYKKGGKAFPDHSGDGKITQKDILMAKGVIPKTKGKK